MLHSLVPSALALLAFTPGSGVTPPSCDAVPGGELLGDGTAGALGVPRLGVVGPALVGQSQSQRVTAGAPGAPGLLFYSPAQFALELPPYQVTFFPSSPLFFEAFVLDAEGRADGLFAWPALPEFLCGATVTSQAALLDATGPGGATWTQGLSITYGPTVPLLFGEPQATLDLDVHDVAFADFNHDGLVDVASSSNAVVVDVSLARSIGVFEEPVSYYTDLDFPRGLAVGDLDGDGSLDIASAKSGSSEIGILRNVGTGAFVVAPEIPIGPSPRDVVAVDLDLDGHLDLAATSHGVHSVYVRLNDGSGSFGGGSAYGVGLGPKGIAAGDLDLDGFADIVTASAGFDTASVLLGGGDGTLTFHATLAAGDGPTQVAIGDADGDGLPDIAVANRGTSDVSLFLGLGGAAFAPESRYAVGLEPNDIAFADATGDGLLDVVTANTGSDDISLLVAAGDGSLAPAEHLPAGDQPRAVAVMDLTNDGTADIGVAHGESENAVILAGVGGGSFMRSQRLDSSSNANALTIADLDQDGNQDIVVVGEDGLIEVHLNLGAGVFAAPLVSYPVSEDFESVAVGLFDGNGLPDIVAAGEHGTYAFMGLGGGLLAAATNVPVQTTFPELLVHEMTGDGLEDIVLPTYSLGTVRVAESQGDGTFTVFSIPIDGGLLTDLAIADVDDDGFDDLVAVKAAGLNSIAVVKGLGAGQFGLPATYVVDVQQPLGVADVDLDGNVDLLVHVANEGLHVLEGFGDGTFASPGAATIPDTASEALFADFTGDGILDVVRLSSPDDHIETALGLGDGTFFAPQAFATGVGPRKLALGDLDGVGGPDVAVLNNEGSVSLLLNQL